MWVSILAMKVSAFFLTGDVTISGGITLTVLSDLNGPSPQFTLTCISTGGPATTVTWTRDSTTVTEGTETVLDDPVTAQYTHTLTVTGRVLGIYTCTVTNNKPSSASPSLALQGIDSTHIPHCQLKLNSSVWLSYLPWGPLLIVKLITAMWLLVCFLSLPQFHQLPFSL